MEEARRLRDEQRERRRRERAKSIKELGLEPFDEGDVVINSDGDKKHPQHIDTLIERDFVMIGGERQGGEGKGGGEGVAEEVGGSVQHDMVIMMDASAGSTLLQEDEAEKEGGVDEEQGVGSLEEEVEEEVAANILAAVDPRYQERFRLSVALTRGMLSAKTSTQATI